MDFTNRSCMIYFLFCRNVGPFRKRLYNEDNVEMNNSIDGAIPVYHDTVLNTGNGSVPKDVFPNNTNQLISTLLLLKSTKQVQQHNEEVRIWRRMNIKVNDLKLKMNTIH
jgi:hypothetical protein